MNILGFEIKKAARPGKLIATVEFVQVGDRLTYQFKNGKGETLKFTDVNEHFLFPLISSVERLFWVDVDGYTKLTQDEFKDWYIRGMKNQQSGDPKAFYDAYQEIVAKRGKDERQFG